LGSGICKKNTQLFRRKFINMLLYIIGVILFAGIFAAYIQSQKDNPKSNLWERFSYLQDEWNVGAIVLLIFGSLFWFAAIPIWIVYRIAYKIFKTKTK